MNNILILLKKKGIAVIIKNLVVKVDFKNKIR